MCIQEIWRIPPFSNVRYVLLILDPNSCNLEGSAAPTEPAIDAYCCQNPALWPAPVAREREAGQEGGAALHVRVLVASGSHPGVPLRDSAAVSRSSGSRSTRTGPSTGSPSELQDASICCHSHRGPLPPPVQLAFARRGVLSAVAVLACSQR